MSKPKAKPNKNLTRKNPTDPLLLAREVVDAAIGETLMPEKKRTKKLGQLRKQGKG